jgi:predicted site-specific integrase-resolvase
LAIERLTLPAYASGMSTNTPLLTDIDVGDLLQVPTSHVRRYVRENKIPFVTLPNGEIRFLADEFWRWIAERKEQPLAEASRR